MARAWPGNTDSDPVTANKNRVCECEACCRLGAIHPLRPRDLANYDASWSTSWLSSAPWRALFAEPVAA